MPRRTKYDYTVEVTLNDTAIIGPFTPEHLYFIQTYGGWNDRGLPLDLGMGIQIDSFTPDIRLCITRKKVSLWQKWKNRKRRPTCST